MSELPKLILPVVKDMRLRIDKRKFDVKEENGYWVVAGRREDDLGELLEAYFDLYKRNRNEPAKTVSST